MTAWLKGAWRWLLLALAVILPGVGWYVERRGRLREKARANYAEGALQRDNALAKDFAEIDRREAGSRIEISAETERVAAPLEAAAQASAELAESVATTPEPSAELLEQIARRNNLSLEATRAAAASLRDDAP